jgi:uncharacterized membrane protein HdeD (DUF308 family)
MRVNRSPHAWSQPSGALGPMREGASFAIGLGAALAALGVLTLVYAGVATYVSVVLVGALVLGGGVAQVVHASRAHRWGGTVMSLLTGVLYGIVGLLMMTRPASSAAALTLLFATLFVVGGLVRAAIAIAERFRGFGWALASSAVSVALGVLVWVGWPVTSVWLIGTFVGVELVVHGVSWVALGLAARDVRAPL